jgi:hypothetical protein
MREVQLYIGSDRVELFGGDSINITDSIRNAKDIAKVFTTFSTQFTVPASKTNNRIFKHYYNYNIDNAYSFDARKKVSGRIEIDNLPFKTGRLKLDGVDMRNNAPYAYRITFYGSIVDLKDLLGEDKLPALTALDIDKDYSPTGILNALTATGGAAADGTIVPLITCSQNLYYDSSQNSEQSGNLYYGTVNQGVKFDQLKYAIKITKIIEAIESKYSQISFADTSFFKAADQYDFNQLYMWCHRKKGTQEITSGGDYAYNFVSLTGDGEGSLDGSGHYVMGGDADYQIRTIDIEIDVDTGYEGVAYEVVLLVNDVVNTRYPNLLGNQSIPVEIGNSFDTGDVVSVKINTYDETLGLTQNSKITFVYLYESQGGDLTRTDNANLFTTTFASTYTFNIADNMPDMKIIDFLSSLFKMFNLVAYVDDNDKIQVQTLDEFYSTEERDISEYIDVEKSQVNAALPYKEIIFGYSDTKTLLAQQHYQEIAEVDANGRGPFEWGAVEYSTNDSDLSGGTYKVQPDFHHMKFEKLIDEFNGNDVNVQVGYYVDDNEEDYLGKPLIFYSTTFNPSILLGFLTRTGRLSFGTAAVYYPSNYRGVDDDTAEQIHFNPERNEYTNTVGTSTLFSRYYQNYIENLFDSGTRIIKVSSVLPTRILTKLTLADIVVINEEKFRINSYNANLNTGRTELELINKYD